MTRAPSYQVSQGRDDDVQLLLALRYEVSFIPTVLDENVGLRV